MGKPEGRIEDYLCARAELYGYLCLKFTSPGTNGVPDRVLIGHGSVFFVEVKAPGEEPRRLQETTIGDMVSYGAEVHVIDTRDGVDRLFREKHPDFRPPEAETGDARPGRPTACRRVALVMLRGKPVAGRETTCKGDGPQ